VTDTREQSVRRHVVSTAIVAAAAIVAVLPFVPAARARSQAPDPSDIADGLRLYEQKANCQACHGWAGDGRKADNQMPDGANLRETKLTRAGLVMTIKCGRLNTQMPAFDKYAYSDGRCYGKTQADLTSYPTRMPDPPATLQAREIDLLTDFMLAKIVGKGPMDHAKCVDFWGSDVDACREFPK
jgi:mono/diheme cytochrome c family protein